jgi:hypothetical protein
MCSTLKLLPKPSQILVYKAASFRTEQRAADVFFLQTAVFRSAGAGAARSSSDMATITYLSIA